MKSRFGTFTPAMPAFSDERVLMKMTMNSAATLLLAMSAPLALTADEGWPFVIVRSYGSYLENRAFTDRLFAAQERHPDLVNEIWFFNSGDDFGDPEAFARIAAEGCLPAKATCQKLGIRFSYQQGVTLNHEEDGIRRANVPDDAWMVNSSGRILRGLFCCTSPFAKKISRAKAKAVMAALKPDSYWTDDDLRIGRGEGNPQGCFCARCTKLFSESVGRQFDRVSLVAALVGSRPDPAIRRAWCEFNGKMLGEYAKVYREAADAVSPSIRVCQQAPYAGWAHEGESARPAILSAFAGKVGTGTRPGGGYYSDEHVHGLLPKGVSIARDAAWAAKLPYVKQVCYEAENWPHVGALKNPGGMMSECAYMLAVGCDSLALYWGSGINGESDESYDFFFDTLAAWKPFLLGVRDAFRGTTPCGLSHCFGEGRYSTAMWRQPVDVEAVAAVARNGVPMADALAAPEAWIFMGYSVEALREEEIPEVFSKAVVLDARDFRRLAARFPKLAFTQKVSFKDPPKEVALATALRRAGFERFARHGQAENPKAFIYPQAQDVVPFSTMTADTNACGTCIVPTEFGGKVVLVQDNTFVFAPAWAGPQHMWPGCRRAGILDALDAAVPGGMSVRLLTDGYAVAVVARQSKDGRTAGAFLLNLGTGETPPLELAIRRGAAKSWRVMRPKTAPTAAEKVRETAGETVLRIPSLPAFGVSAVIAN